MLPGTRYRLGGLAGTDKLEPTGHSSKEQRNFPYERNSKARVRAVHKYLSLQYIPISSPWPIDARECSKSGEIIGETHFSTIVDFPKSTSEHALEIDLACRRRAPTVAAYIRFYYSVLLSSLLLINFSIVLYMKCI